MFTEICGAAYYGKLIGKLSELHHGVSGEVYAVDGRTLFIKDFTYDGEAPSSYKRGGAPPTLPFRSMHARRSKTLPLPLKMIRAARFRATYDARCLNESFVSRMDILFVLHRKDLDIGIIVSLAFQIFVNSI